MDTQRKNVLVGAVAAFLATSPSILMIIYGIAGSSGNSFVTAFVSAGTLAFLFLLTFKGIPQFTVGDILYVSFVVCVLTSLSINTWQTNLKETTLLSFSILAYVGCRSIERAQLSYIRQGFIWVAGIVVGLGTIFTTFALIAQWDDPHGKPLVFGFSFAVLLFTGSFGFWVIALTSSRLDYKRTAAICAATAFPAAVFSASMVRFTLVAIFGSLIVAIVLERCRNQKKYLSVIAATMVVAICFGLAIRYRQAVIFMEYAAEISEEKDQPTLTGGEILAPSRFALTRPDKEKAPSCYLDINIYNSVTIREALLKDGLTLAQIAGPFGFGLDAFMTYTCVQGTEVHNSALQSLVEFGWLGGISFILLMAYAGLSTFKMAREDRDARFFFCCFVYVVAISMAHGRISRERELFALLGTAAGIVERLRPPLRVAVAIPPRSEA